MRRKEKKVSWMGELKVLPQEPVSKASSTSRIARRLPALSSTRKALLKDYKRSYDEIPDSVRCAACGAHLRKEDAERHHPAGRRKDAFLFTVMIHPRCHQKVHAQPDWATKTGLLWSGRNSRQLTLEDARMLVMRMPAPPLYALEILRNFSPSNTCSNTPSATSSPAASPLPPPSPRNPD